jgi:Tfp pilus assembly protein PilE
VKASKGFLLLDLAVVLLLLGTLLLFVLNSFKGCISALARTKEIREAQTLAESTLFGEVVEAPTNWQVVELERVVQGVVIKEVQVLDGKNGKVLFNLIWAQ